MKLDYDVTLDDLVAFNRHWVATSRLPQLRWARVWGSAALTGIVFLLLYFTLARDSPQAAGITALIVGFVYFLSYRSVQNSSLERNVAKIYSGDSRGPLFGPHTLEIAPEGFIVRSKQSETRTSWAAIRTISVTPQHLFIYTSAAHAHVVPLSRVIQAGELDELLGKIRQQVSPEVVRDYRKAGG